MKEAEATKNQDIHLKNGVLVTVLFNFVF